MEMDFASFLNFLTNLSFLFLLGSMIFYWVGLSIGTKSNDPTLPSTEVTQCRPAPPAAGALAQPPGGLAAVEATPLTGAGRLGLGSPPFGGGRSTPTQPSHLRNVLQQMGNLGMISSNLILFFLLGSRWMESGHFPSSNLYESLMFLSWCFTTLHLFLSLRYTNFSPLFKPSEANDTLFLGAITTPSALFTNAFATITLPKGMQEAAPLVPALQSNWLMMHVTVMILSYAALILGSLLSIAFLIVTSLPVKKTDRQRPRGTGLFLQDSLTTPLHPELPLGVAKGEALLPETSGYPSLPVSKGSFIGGGTSFSSVYSLAFYLDNLSYRILGIGFPFLTIGILSGAVWANEAWGSYWSWDPKETWALLTWLIFAIYLHTRLNIKDEEEKGGWGAPSPVGGATPGRQGATGGREGAIEKLNKKPAIVASFGFIVVWICYLGVNLIGEGLHSYGWIDVS